MLYDSSIVLGLAFSWALPGAANPATTANANTATATNLILRITAPFLLNPDLNCLFIPRRFAATLGK